LDGFLQPDGRTEDFEAANRQKMVLGVIFAGLAQADHAEEPEPRDRKRLHRKRIAEVGIVLAPVDFRPTDSVV
jgi:hypothetical protein